MESLDYWRLCDELSVVQAALLIVGEDPSESQDHVLDSSAQNRPKGFDAAFSALQNAINVKTLPATIRHEARYLGSDEYPNTYETVIKDGDAQHAFKTRPNWAQTTVNVTDLKAWLVSRGFRTGFFFVDDVAPEDFLDPNHPCYAPKLAAAVTAWVTFSRDGMALSGKTPKQAMTKWLRENAPRYGLTDEEGKVNETGIEEISKIANWKPEGGAAKTPGAANLNPPTPLKPNKDQRKSTKSK